jgi:hypothetical protein
MAWRRVSRGFTARAGRTGNRRSGSGSRRIAAVAVIVLVACLGIPVGAQADVQSLSGELLEGAGPGSPNGIPTSTYDCNPSGASSADWSVSGTAVGPYPGTFTESGSVTFGPQSPLATVTSFQARFTITSSAGTVTGTKTLAANPTEAVAFCNQIGGQVVVDTSYQATITTPTGSADDQGTANGTQFNLCPDATTCGIIDSGLTFFEAFNSTQITQNPSAPTGIDDCKQGGWKNYPALGFKNQGDCVSYVATRGKNPPAGTG